MKNTKPPVGQALTDEAAADALHGGSSEPRWIFAFVAATLGFFCGLRACEIRGLQWKHVDWLRNRLQVRRSKTPAGWRDPSLNRRARRPQRTSPARRQARHRRRRALPLSVAWPQQSHRPHTSDDLMAHGLAFAPRRRRSHAPCASTMAVTRRSRGSRGGTTGLGDPGADGTRLAVDDEDLQPRPTEGARIRPRTRSSRRSRWCFLSI